MTAIGFLDDLNAPQRAAVTFGLSDDRPAKPDKALLTIAGAGSGKTRMLVHRAATLILNGADPRCLLMLTFSRRAAAEMIRRVERLCAEAVSHHRFALAGSLEWAGTFTRSRRGCCGCMPMRSGSIPAS